MAQKFEFTSTTQYTNQKRAYEVSNPFGDWIIQSAQRTTSDKVVKITVQLADPEENLNVNLKIKVTIYAGVNPLEFIMTKEVRNGFVNFLFESNQHVQYSFKVSFEQKPVAAQEFSFVEPPAPLPNSTASYMSSLFDSNKFADITIKTADGKEIKAAKLVLSRSSVFDAMLNHHDTMEAQSGVIQITDIDHEVMTELIRYMYSDEIPKLKEMALELMFAANKYNLPGLLEICKNYLMANISHDTFANVLVYADKLELEDLEKAIMEYILKHNETALASDEWKQLKEDHVQVAMKVMEHRFKASK